jgi:hypothetical protein
MNDSIQGGAGSEPAQSEGAAGEEGVQRHRDQGRGQRLVGDGRGTGAAAQGKMDG